MAPLQKVVSSIKRLRSKEENRLYDTAFVTNPQTPVFNEFLISRISDYIHNRCEPTLRIARQLCQILGITPAEMLGIAA